MNRADPPPCALGVLLLFTCASSCQSPETVRASPSGDFAQALRADLEMPVAVAPFDRVQANWKERLDQAYACIEVRGSYTQTARELKGVLEAVQRAGLQVSGAPFALFYDDPGHTPVDELRSRACVPIDGDAAGTVGGDATLAAPYTTDVLPSATVVYAFVGGPYGEVPRAYPGVFAFVDHMHWKECGPIREVYLVPPGSVSSWNELVCEVQIPAQPAH